ncbi:MAG: hypothetical protein EAZ89_17825, partial [Bacteroidetes bacterium]
MKKLITLIIVSGGLFSSVFAQDLPGSQVSGSFQTDVQYLFPDSVIGAADVPEKVRSNSYLQLNWQSGPLSAAVRYEAYLNPLLGFDPRYQGLGISYRSFTYRKDRIEITAGNFYDQFGNGIIFRSYQEWALGIDNSVDGVRIQFKPVNGLIVKGLIGKQRRFFDRSKGLVRGADAEFSFNDAIASFRDRKTRLSLGASVVSRYEADDDPRLSLPENVSAFATRMRLSAGNLSVDAEFASKINDPFQLNKYVYNSGNAFYLNAVYTYKRFGFVFSGKRIDNFDFRSERRVTLQESTLSFLPAISKLHTYRLPTLYPYATQLNGEVGFQAALVYSVAKNTPLGGKYGTQINLNYSRIHGLDTVFTEPGFRYTSSLIGDVNKLYFQDVNVDINHKWNTRLRTIFTYIWLRYNMDVIQFGTLTGGYGIVNSHSAIAEIQYRLAKKVAFRCEFQHMYTRQDMGSWAM